MIIDIIVPKAGESVTEADIASWMKEDGDFVNMDEAILELETDKASLQMAAESAGQLQILVAEGETVLVGDVIGKIDTSKVGAAPAPVKEEAPVVAAPTPAPAAATPAPVAANPAPIALATTDAGGVMNEKIPSPAAKKLIIENNLSVQDIPASGKGGRITKADVLSVLSTTPQKTSRPVVEPPSPVVLGDRPKRLERMSRLRRTVAERLVEAQKTAAILTTFNEVDMSGIMNIRKLYKEKFKSKYDVNLGFMSFFAKAASNALAEFPIMNAQVDGTNIVYNDFVDLGIAVSTPKGLVVPVIRDLQDMSFSEIEKTIIELAIKGRNADLTPDDMSGGTFTITNGGTFGSMLSTPILNRPQSAILGMHNIVQRPVAVDGQVVIRPIMYLAVSYDHRIIDGSDAVRFLVKIKEYLEDPTRIMLEL
jgi:2-oxoglutarate dehydrogenase E2 component (dihydrolipoamide succinyltransferase)